MFCPQELVVAWGVQLGVLEEGDHLLGTGITSIHMEWGGVAPPIRPGLWM